MCQRASSANEDVLPRQNTAIEDLNALLCFIHDLPIKQPPMLAAILIPAKLQDHIIRALEWTGAVAHAKNHDLAKSFGAASKLILNTVRPRREVFPRR